MCIPLQDEIVAACKDIITVHDHGTEQPNMDA